MTDKDPEIKIPMTPTEHIIIAKPGATRALCSCGELASHCPYANWPTDANHRRGSDQKEPEGFDPESDVMIDCQLGNHENCEEQGISPGPITSPCACPCHEVTSNG